MTRTRKKRDVGPRPTKERVKQVIEEVEAHDLPDGAHWAMIHERL